MIRAFATVVLFCVLQNSSIAQCSTHPVTLSHTAEQAFPIPDECMSALHDQSGRNYLYVAGKERGLLVFDVSTPASPVLVDSIKVSNLGGMEVTSLAQDGDYLYLALGNIFVNSSRPGMAIIDISTPASCFLLSVWQYPVQSGGAGVVRVEGNYAYLGAMRRGLMILDVSNKVIPTLVSVFHPVLSYPIATGTPDSLKFNARGMAVRNSIVYLCDDKGGLRVIDATTKSAPVEVGRYANPVVTTKGIYYNNAVLNDTLLYVAVDYCGMEILDVSDNANVRQLSWWNPWGCDGPSNNWLNSGGHSNELQYDAACHMVFLASGKSEVTAVNVSDPASPELCASYTTAGGNVGVWGLGLYQGFVYACYIYVPLGIPFSGNWSGFKTLGWNPCTNAVSAPTTGSNDPLIYPNPATGSLQLAFHVARASEISILITDMLGRCVKKTQVDIAPANEDVTVDIADLPPGHYAAGIRDGLKSYFRIIEVQRH